ncbi:alpha/beta hydrolase [Acinetobacter sp. VNH17]|uniref:Alpha/beta hydrolase n=1 Tax=Acinetobacter thutiue TaxID=2998078 RepID=A0ABT7WLQ5_9GAMM|nr:alpha/beta hydrolase [Acinetobacter thutiue]MCY6411475.1 alpha/beta hydrolase [Acinetobacter thutiue]MDN0013577.1 alpha/beta hydrolase [Acinetobacter thutiue]
MQPTHTIEKMISTAQGKIFVKIWQPNPSQQIKEIPILLFHDSLGCVQLWRDFPDQLCLVTNRMIIAYDRLGFGRSDVMTTKLPINFIQQESEIFAELLHQLEIPEVINFGHSVGGGIAVSCAAQYPSLCRAIITEAAQAYVEPKTLTGITLAKQMFQEPEQFQRLKKYHAEKAQWVLDAWTETWLSTEFRNWTLDQDLGSLSAKILILHGDHDEYGTLEQPKRLAQYTDAQIHIIQNCGHVPHRENPQQIIEIVRDFVETYA